MGEELTGRKVVGPGDVGVLATARLGRPIASGRPLVRASGDRGTRDQMGLVDLRGVQVVPGGQAGLEDQHRRGRLGQHDAVELDPHDARGTKGVDPGVGVARMDEDLLVLLEPVVHGLPVEADGAGEPGHLGLGVEVCAARTLDLAHPQAVALGAAPFEVRAATFVDQGVTVDVADRDVVLRVERPFEDVQSIERVEDGRVAERPPHPSRRGLDVVGGDDRAGKVIHRAGSPSSSPVGTVRHPGMGGALTVWANRGRSSAGIVLTLQRLAPCQSSSSAHTTFPPADSGRMPQFVATRSTMTSPLPLWDSEDTAQGWTGPACSSHTSIETLRP